MKKLITVLAVLAVSAPALADDQFSLTTGLDYSTGKYGNATSTNMLYVPVIGQYEADKLTLKLTVPYVSVSGPGGVIQGMGRVASPAATAGGTPTFGRTAGGTATTTNAGLGDVIASAGYTAYTADALSLDVVGKVKFGTADANKGLGTGKNDYSAQLDGYYTQDKSTLFATAGYKIVGAPTGVAVNNVLYGMLGANQKLSQVTNVGMMISFVQSAFATGSNQRDVTVYASQKLTKSLKLQANLLKGFSSGSPDYGGGVMITGYF
jgi:hypothetical protein